MSGDFTIVTRGRVRFGDLKKDPGEVDTDSAALLLGESGSFPFACPGVDSTKKAVLQFAHRGSRQVSTFPDPQPDGGLIGITPEHTVEINGVRLAGGIPAAPTRDGMSLWNTRLLLIPPHVLRHDNVFRVETRAVGSGGGLDNFTLDNVVVFYKTRQFIRLPIDVSGQLEEQEDLS